MNEKRMFHLGDVLSITTGRLVSLRHIEGIYDILNFMTGDDLYTHQLPRGMSACRPYLLVAHPDLAGVEVPELTAETWRGWLDEMIARFGAEREVERLPAGAWEQIDPLAELRQMAPDKPIIAVVAGAKP